jgi:endonuclease/exonuclease/phosphatase family metal-dependent hydrolase
MTLRSALVAMALVTIFRLAGYLTEPRLTDAEIHRVFSGREGSGSTRPAARPLRIVTWNIERGVRLQGIVDKLKALDGDVILLQEADRFCRRSGGRDVPREIAKSLGMNWAFGGEFQEIGEGDGSVAATTGQAILSREPIEEAKVMVFGDQVHLRWSLNPVQPRRGGRIALTARTAGIVVYNLHLESGGTDQLRQRQLDEVLADSGGRALPHIIAGDLNSSATGTPTMVKALAAADFSDTSAPLADRRTSVHHEHPIDWVFVRDIAALDGRVSRVENVSDHYPLIVSVSTAP